MEKNISAKYKPISDVDLVKKYITADKRIYNTVKNAKVGNTDELIMLIGMLIAGQYRELTKSNQRFLGILDVDAKTTADKQNMRINKNIEYPKQQTFIELQSNLKFAENQLMNRLKKTVKNVAETPAHLKEVKQAILTDFNKNGITTVQYSNGATIKLENYVKTCTRTARTETANRTSIAAAQQKGSDLVFIPKLNSTCPTCALYEGRVYSISGNDKRFPPLYQTVLRHGYDSIHPNCRHHFQPYFEDNHTKQEQQQWLKDSNRPFIDNRTEQARKAYIEVQSFNRKVLNESNEYATMKETLKDDMPYKTIGGFRRAKRKNSNEYISAKNQSSILESQIKRQAIKFVTHAPADNLVLTKIAGGGYSNSIIITNERIRHIEDRHPGFYKKHGSDIRDVIKEPDYIIKSNKAPSTAIMLKDINGQHLEVILKLYTGNNSKFGSSIISAWNIKQKTYNKLLKGDILYKK